MVASAGMPVILKLRKARLARFRDVSPVQAFSWIV